MKPAKQSVRPLTPDDVREIVRDLDDDRVALILATGATCEELEEASAWPAGESDVMGEMERPLAGVIARLYDILVRHEEFAENRWVPRRRVTGRGRDLVPGSVGQAELTEGPGAA